MAKALVIVESPTKARTIEKFLGKGYMVTASYGHVRDLPDSATEIPESVKKEKWSRIGINVDQNFEPLYIIPDQKKKRVAELRAMLKEADEVLLATDEDREGESISWHLVEVLKPKIPVKRMVFHEITKEAIAEAIATPRSIDENLVRAQETRRIIDRLFGYSVSPLLWKKIAPRLSAGRVQSVALRLLVDRERERIKFRSAHYWDLKGLFSKAKSSAESDRFEAELTQLNGKRIAIGKDFDPSTGKLKADANVVLLDGPAAEALKSQVAGKQGKVSSIEEKPFTQRPAAPFTTSTLQQEASRKLGFSARRTMQVAQNLYENGLITYMRTDSTTLSEEALNASRSLIKREYGQEYLYPEPRIYKTKVKNAQEAHEAIRPAGAEFATIEQVREKFGAEASKLYEMIWKRTIASQMTDSRGIRVAVQIELGPANFRASGTTIEFPGFLRAYVEGSDDPEAELADREKILPRLAQGESLDVIGLEALDHETQPPARFTEGSLIKELERLGIGRPSTWATIVDVVLSRTYAFKKGTALVPTFLAHSVIGLMERFFKDVVDFEFTARMEDDLDNIAVGQAENLAYLKKFYFGNGHPGLKNLVKNGEEKIDPRDVCGIPIGQAADGRNIEVRIGRYGPFLTNGETRASLPDMIAPDEVTVPVAEDLLVQAQKGPASLGTHPENGLQIYLKKGRFGPYIQLGEMVEGGDKPKMASLLPGMLPDTVTLEQALKILELPRIVGKNPENNEDIVASNGRFGPYIKCGTDTRSLGPISPIDVTLEQAIDLLKQPKRRGRGSTPALLREIGKHPVSEKMIALRSGRYGPYVSDGEINASLQRGSDPEKLTLEDAVNLINARAAYVATNGSKKGRGRKKPTKQDAEKAEKPAAKKAKKRTPKAKSGEASA
ncbi:MAG: type I DNA topoisomerase [Oligoflexia bacterium]|nr:type I DNA topoisomerase [Oligoflexia bacterium]